MTFLFAALLSASACNYDNPDPEILSDSVPKMVIDGRTIMEYRESSCQLGADPEGRIYFVCTDSMSDFFHVTLERRPCTPGEEITATSVRWTTPDDNIEKNNVVFKLIQLENDTIWLWSPKLRMALVLRSL